MPEELVTALLGSAPDQHKMPNYLLDTIQLVNDANSHDTSFFNLTNGLAASLRHGIPWQGDTMQLAIGTPNSDTFPISTADSFVFGNGGVDNFQWWPTLLQLLAGKPIIIDGGLGGQDTLTIYQPAQGWSWKPAAHHEVDLYFGKTLEPQLVGVAQITFLDETIHLPVA